jgi:regulator of protease activity HflC (stomatin/prohibitin superfamily)
MYERRSTADKAMDIINQIQPFTKKAWIIGGAIVGILLILMFNPFYKVPAGNRGVVLNWGAVGDTVRGEGLHVRVPVAQQIVMVNVQIQKSQTDADAASKDLQVIHTQIALNYHIIPEKANVVYQNIGLGYKEKVIDPAVQEIVKAVTARYTAVELITQREKVRGEIHDMLASRLIVNNIAVNDFAVMNFKFSDTFTTSIEAKQTAEQNAFKAERDLTRIKTEAEQKIASAKGEAEALRLQRENVTPLLLQLRMIEVLEKRWNGQMPSVITGGSGGLMLDATQLVKEHAKK